jgi:beta-alanine--pyruvate transaminase
VFFTNSGSESVDTALKIALAYHRVKGDAARSRLLGRERGYHGVGFGGISVGGMVANRKAWPASMIPASIICRTRTISAQRVLARPAAHGAEFADDSSGWWRCTTRRPSRA